MKMIEQAKFLYHIIRSLSFQFSQRIECENTVVGEGWVGKQQEGETETET